MCYNADDMREITTTQSSFKEFIELATKNLERLQDQYEKSLQGAKEQLRSLLS